MVSEANQLCRYREPAGGLYSANSVDHVADVGHRWVHTTSCEKNLAAVESRLFSRCVLVLVKSHKIQRVADCPSCVRRIWHAAHKLPARAVLRFPTISSNGCLLL